jgi:putative phosphoesterase
VVAAERRLTHRIGIISDTHGTVPDGVDAAFAGVVLIIHAGDVGPGEVLSKLSAIAPVEAIAGNTDITRPTCALPSERAFTHTGMRFYVAHDLDPWTGAAPPDADIVIAGHTHRPEVLDLHGQTFINPGSASRSRTPDGLGTVAVVELGKAKPQVTIVQLPGRADPHR